MIQLLIILDSGVRETLNDVDLDELLRVCYAF